MILVVVMVGAEIVADENATFVIAYAVPVGVSNSAVVSLNNGLIFKLVVEFESVVHNILAMVPFLYSAGGANAAKMLEAM